MVTLTNGNNKNIKNALSAKPGINPEGDPGPMIYVNLSPGSRRASGLEQGFPYKNNPVVSHNTQPEQQSTRSDIKLAPPIRPSTEHHYEYNSRSGRMEKKY